MAGCHVPIYKEPTTCICVTCLDNRIKKLEDKAKVDYGWKNAKIELPAQDNIVLSYSDKVYYVANYFKNENVFRINNYPFPIIHVSHWMYLPPEPKN